MNTIRERTVEPFDASFVNLCCVKAPPIVRKLFKEIKSSNFKILLAGFFLQSPANPDLLYIIFFCHTQLTITLLLALIFGSKVYLVYRSGGKPSEDIMSLGVKFCESKFISRSQARMLANASTATSSTAQHGANQDSRLSEQEALEHVKQLYDELKNLHDRIQPNEILKATITSLLESFRSSQQLSLPWTEPPTNPVLLFSDKSTSTTFITDSQSNQSSDEKYAVLPAIKPVKELVNENSSQVTDYEDNSLFLHLPLESMCTCSRIDINEFSNIRENFANQTKCSRNINTLVDCLNQQQNDHTHTLGDENCRAKNVNYTNNTNFSNICEICLHNLTEFCSSSNCVHKAVNDSSLKKSNKNLNLVSVKDLSDDGEIVSSRSTDRISIIFIKSFENTEANSELLWPTTSAPIVSISSSFFVDDKIKRDNLTSVILRIKNDEERMEPVDYSCTSNNFSLSTQNKITSITLNGNSVKAAKRKPKLVLDLDDRKSTLSLSKLQIFTPYMKNASVASELTCQNIIKLASKNSWMTGQLFIRFLKHYFVPYLEKIGIVFPIVYFVDDHKSQVTFEFSLTCIDSEIIIERLSLHLFQPVDVCLFHGLNAVWNAALEELGGFNNGYSTKSQNFEMIHNAPDSMYV